MANNELGTNLAEVGTDCISRQQAIDALEKCHKQCCREDATGDEWIHYETTLNEVESILPAQPERIKGHWIHVGGTRYRCNKCGEIARKGNFCPNCGADMRGEQDG